MQDATWWERIKGWLFHAFPHHLVSRITFRLARLDTPLKDTVTRLFIRAFNVDMSEAAEPDPRRYASFNAFFTRALKSGARPVASGVDAIASPADGAISQLGEIEAGRIFQAKGQSFSVLELLGGSAARAAPFTHGKFCTIYLSPRDYHRVHMPLDGRLKEMVHVPGRLFSVSQYATRVIPRLFARNERMAAIFDTACGPMAVVMVGAVNVSAIETVWAGLVTPPAGKGVRSIDYTRDAAAAVRLERGEEMGRFNMGSTAIVLFGDRRVAWDAGLRVDMPVKMGEAIGRAAFVSRRADHAVSQENAIA